MTRRILGGGSTTHPTWIALLMMAALGPGSVAGMASRAQAVPIQEGGIAGTLEQAGVRLLALEEPAAVAEYFRDHRVAVAAVRTVSAPAAGTWPVTLGYTSVNFGGEDGGSTVWFPHDATLTVTPKAEEMLAGVDWRRSLLVLELLEGDDDSGGIAFEVVGVAAPLSSDGVEIDWFADKPELLHRGDEG